MHRSLSTTTRIAPQVAALSALLQLQLAHAAPQPPANDDFADATLITGPEFTDHLQTTAATTEPDDPDCFGNGPTVWYAYTPEFDEAVHADTYGSKYDTTLSVYTDGSSDPLTQLACNDDYFPTLQSSVDFQASAGVTYFFMVGAFASGDGGPLRFNFEVEPPLEISVFLDPTSIVDGDGLVSLALEARCSRPAQIEVSGVLTQKIKGDTASGSFDGMIDCEQVVFFSTDPFAADVGAFVPGSATVQLSAFGTATDDGDLAEFSTKGKIELVGP